MFFLYKWNSFWGYSLIYMFIPFTAQAAIVMCVPPFYTTSPVLHMTTVQEYYLLSFLVCLSTYDTHRFNPLVSSLE